MELQDIKKSVDRGETVYWKNPGYQVVKNGTSYDILCLQNDSRIGLTHQDGITMNGNENDFYKKDDQNEIA